MRLATKGSRPTTILRIPMNYLSPSEYETYGLEATTPAAWVLAASTVIDAHCRRVTLGVAQYEERLRIAAGRNTVRVTYVPLAAVAPATTPIVSARGRYAIPRRGEWPFDDGTRSKIYPKTITQTLRLKAESWKTLLCNLRKIVST